MSDPVVEIKALCEMHEDSGHLVLRHEEGRIVLDGHAHHCCVLVMREKAAGLLFDVLGQWLG